MAHDLFEKMKIPTKFWTNRKRKLKMSYTLVSKTKTTWSLSLVH